MISNFPEPYPDELFYSICARFSERMQYPSGRSVVRELFGSANAIACVSLPSHLDYFVAQVLPHSSYSADNIIDNHTLSPMFAAFLPPERQNRLLQDMRGDKGLTLHMHAGIMASRVPLPQWLRFCPRCAEGDRQNFDECYWHRIHQVPGAEICPTHSCWLRNSAARAREMRTRYEFVSAERALKGNKPEESNQNARFFEALSTLVLGIKWLFDTKPLSQCLSSLQERYQGILYDLGLSTYRGRVNKNALLSRFKGMYSPELLSLLRCELDEHIEDSWLMRLVRKPDNAQHPLHHLLLIDGLGFTAEQFFSIPTRNSPFGNGPWPCLNPTCHYYGQRKIQECQVTYSPYLKGKPTGSFSCICGFVYTRSGPDVLAEDWLKVGRIQSYGEAWEAQLKILWNDDEFSIREIARQLGVDSLTVKRHAYRLNLPFPRPGGKSCQLKDAQKLRPFKLQILEPQMLEEHQAKWLNMLRECPEANLKVLRSKYLSTYTWLYRNDPSWLKTHLPVTKHRPSRRSSSIDWEKRDKDLAQMVEASVDLLKNRKERPVRITISSIGKNVGQLALLQQHLSRLPITANRLEMCIETREAFAIRRIRWVVKQYEMEQYIPKRWEIIKRAGIERVISTPGVTEELEHALLQLKNPFF